MHINEVHKYRDEKDHLMRNGHEVRYYREGQSGRDAEGNVLGDELRRDALDRTPQIENAYRSNRKGMKST